MKLLGGGGGGGGGGLQLVCGKLVFIASGRVLDFRSNGPRFDPRPRHGYFLRVRDLHKVKRKAMIRINTIKSHIKRESSTHSRFKNVYEIHAQKTD